MIIENGCIFIARQIQISEIWEKPAEWLKVWIYVLQEVNHADNKLFKRGENLFNYNDMVRDCRVKYNSIAKFIKWAKLARLVATQKTTRGVVIFVLNYDKYQTLNNYKGDTKSDTSGKIEAKQKRNRGDTINKNDINNMNEKNKRMSETDFDSFWSEYPRKESKQESLKRFLKLDKELMPVILEAVKRQKASAQWQEPKYIPHPSKWLNQARWEDQPVLDPRARLPDEKWGAWQLRLSKLDSQN